MSLSETTVMSTETSSGLFAETVGGLATIVLTILGLSGVASDFLLAITTIVFGAALLIEGTSIVARFAHAISGSPATSSVQLRTFQLPTILTPRCAPISISVNRDRPRHMTMLPGAGSLARAR